MDAQAEALSNEERSPDLSGIRPPTPKRQLSSDTTPPPSTPASTSSFEHIIPTPPLSTAITPLSPNMGSASATPNDSGTPHKSRSILNLTSSTLLGIYSPTGYDAHRDELATPWGTGAQTPARHPSSASVDAAARPQIPSTADFAAARKRPAKTRARARSHGQVPRPARRWGMVVLRTAALFAIGVAYGVLITHLHDARGLAPVKVGIRRGRRYLAIWGMLGVALGTLLPWLDFLWEDQGRRKRGQAADDEDEDENEERERRDSGGNIARNIRSSLGADWNPIVRSVGAFVGIAFAIVSLTLALVNPVIWYLVDRSKAGFVLSTAVGFAGAAILFSLNPEVVPAPATPSPREAGSRLANGSYAGGLGVPSQDLLLGGLVSYESVGVATWISSVLFCSCVCFGNIGRRLAGTGKQA